MSSEIPEKLFMEIRKRGINIVDLIISLLEKDLDPNTIVEIRIELAEKYFREAEEYINKNDPIQASEKLYKSVEECLKALAEIHKISELEEARKNNRWFTWLLGKAAKTLARKMNEPKIAETWAIAYDIYVWGFHEAKYTIDEIKDSIDYVKWLIEYAKHVFSQRNR